MSDVIVGDVVSRDLRHRF